MRPSNRKMMNHKTGRMVNVSLQFIPPQYNVQSQLTADVQPGEANRFTFELTSR